MCPLHHSTSPLRFLLKACYYPSLSQTPIEGGLGDAGPRRPVPWVPSVPTPAPPTQARHENPPEASPQQEVDQEVAGRVDDNEQVTDARHVVLRLAAP
jgi:hypothetical protein